MSSTLNLALLGSLGLRRATGELSRCAYFAGQTRSRAHQRIPQSEAPHLQPTEKAGP